MRRILLLLPFALLLSGCTEPSIGDCGLLVHVPARPIDEGLRFDVREVVGDPLDLRGLDYRVRNATAAPPVTVYEGEVATLAAQGNHTLRFLDAQRDGLLGVGDAFVLREHGPFVLLLSRGSTLLGSSLACDA